jgi:hypothetical protein
MAPFTSFLSGAQEPVRAVIRKSSAQFLGRRIVPQQGGATVRVWRDKMDEVINLSDKLESSFLL